MRPGSGVETYVQVQFSVVSIYCHAILHRSVLYWPSRAVLNEYGRISGSNYCLQVSAGFRANNSLHWKVNDIYEHRVQLYLARPGPSVRGNANSVRSPRCTCNTIFACCQISSTQTGHGPAPPRLPRLRPPPPRPPPYDHEPHL